MDERRFLSPSCEWVDPSLFAPRIASINCHHLQSQRERERENAAEGQGKSAYCAPAPALGVFPCHE
eukprot:4942-Rhodomonas_salina.2